MRKNGFVFIVAMTLAICFVAVDLRMKEALAQQAPKKVFTWRLQCGFPPPEKILGYLSTYGRAQELSRQVKEKTKGELDIKVFQPGALFKDLESFDALAKGALEMIVSTGSYHVGTVPEAMVEWGLPYGAKLPEQAAELHLRTEYQAILRQAYEKHNAYLLGVFSTSSYNYLTRFPIKTLDDLKGKKIRGAGMSAKIAAAHGATPTTITGSEQYMALQRGTIDGTLYPPYTGISYKLFEVVKYQSWPSVYAASCDNMLVNLAAWKGLPKSLQNVLQEEAARLLRYSFEVSGPALEKIARDEGKGRYGVESIFLADDEFLRFQKAVMPLWDEWSARSEMSRRLVKIAKKVAGTP